MRRLLVEERDAKGMAELSIIGPAPAFIHRLRGRFRWQITLRGSDPSVFLSEIPLPQGWTVDNIQLSQAGPPIPEPCTVALLAAGLGGMLLRRRRRS